MPRADTQLRKAGAKGDVGGLGAALARGADINATDERGWTALMWAAHHNYRPAVDALLEAGADPCVRDRLVQDASDLALHAKRKGKGDPVNLSIHIERHPAYVRGDKELVNEARTFAEELRTRIRGKILPGGGLGCHGDWCIETRYRGMSCRLWVFASGTNLWVQNYRGSGAILSYQIENEDCVGVTGAHELRDLATPLGEFWSEDFPVYCPYYSDSIEETDNFVRANETDLRPIRLERYEWLVFTREQIRLRSLTRDVDATMDRIDHIASIFARTSKPLPKPLIKKAAKIRLHKRKVATTSRKYGHDLWGMPAQPVRCGECAELVHRVVVLDTRDPILDPLGWPWRFLEVLMCLRCSVFAGPSWFRHKDNSIEVLVQQDAGWLDEIEPIDPTALDLVLPKRSPAGKVHKLGGRASWVQGDDTPECPICKKPMLFLLQLASMPNFNFGDGGLFYAFICPPCRVTASLVQSH